MRERPKFKLVRCDRELTYDIVVDGAIVGCVTKTAYRTNAYSYAGRPRPGYHVTVTSWVTTPNLACSEFDTRREAVEEFLDLWVSRSHSRAMVTG